MTGDYTVSASCTFPTNSNVGGADNGNITIDSGQTLTVNAGETIAWGPGKSLIINGSIAIANGAQLKQGRICRIDTDEDGFITNDAPTVATDCTGLIAQADMDVSMTTWDDIKYDADDSVDTVYYGTACDVSATTTLADSFTDSTKIATTTTIAVSSGQVKLVEILVFCSGDAGDHNTTNTVSGGLVYCDNSDRLWTPTQSGSYIWDNGISKCSGLTYAGYSDWELPFCTDDDYLPSSCVLYQFGVDNCSWNGGSGGQSSCTPAWDTNAQASYYWSSTEYNSFRAWYVYFNNGDLYSYFKYFDFYVRCVRGQ